MTVREVAEIFEKVAVLLELSGENQFRVRAYESASRILLAQTLEFSLFLEEVRAGRLKGIGSGLLQAIEELAATGRYSMLEELESSFPNGLLELLNVSGLGPKKIRILRSELGIESLEKLLAACEANRLLELRGFSEKTQNQIKASALNLIANRNRLLLPDSTVAAALLRSKLVGAGAADAELAGEIRRSLPIVSEIEILCSSVPENAKEIESVLASAEIPVRLHISEDESALSLLFAAGSSSHLEQLIERAASLGCTLGKDRFARAEALLDTRSERSIYRELRLAYIPPELREGQGEIAEAAELFERGEEDFDLVTEDEIRGVLHVHSTYSDGLNTIRDLAIAVQSAGFQYLGISDHSQSAVYARGLKLAAIEKQSAEITNLNQELSPFRIFHGIESDILVDGRLDYEDDVLSRFDFVIASIHSRLSLNKEAMTERLLAAVRNPLTTILGHISGRKLLERAPYEADFEAILAAAAESGAAVELNANPRRLELDWQLLPLARKLGIPIPISPDAQSIAGLSDLRWGMMIARKGRLRREDVLNAKTADEFEEWCKSRKNKKLSGRK